MIRKNVPWRGAFRGARPRRLCAAVPRRLAPCPTVSAFPLDDELVVYDPRDGEAYVLNPTAARIWALCDGSHTDVSVAQTIATDFALEHHQALADVRDLIDNLERAGLLAVQ